MKVTKGGKYTRDGHDVEVVLDKHDKYDDVVRKAAEMMELTPKPNYFVALFTSGGL